MAVRRRSAGFGVALAAAAAACGNDGAEATPRYADPVSHLAYETPEGWFGPTTDGLLDYFTSAVSTIDLDAEEPEVDEEAETSALAGTGLFESTFFHPDKGDLRDATNDAAAAFAEFFVPDTGQRRTLIDEELSVSGKHAWHVRLEIVPDDLDEGVTTVDLVAVDLPEPAYLLALVAGDDEERLHEVDEVIDSLEAA